MESKEKEYLIFVVDDDEIYLKFLIHQLKTQKKEDEEYVGFQSGDECIQNLHREPDIVILDYYLNGTRKTAMNGIEVLKKIKTTSPQLPVVMLSSQDKIEVAINCIKYGAYDYVMKNETTFLRMRNVINNLIYTITVKRQAKVYVTWNLIVALLFLSLIAISIVYFYHITH